MDRVLHFVLAIVVVAILALLVSHDRQRSVFVMLFNCLSLKSCWPRFFLNSDIGLGFVKGFSEMFENSSGLPTKGQTSCSAA